MLNGWDGMSNAFLWKCTDVSLLCNLHIFFKQRNGETIIWMNVEYFFRYGPCIKSGLLPIFVDKGIREQCHAIHSGPVYAFHATLVEWYSCDKDHVAHKPIPFSLYLYTKCLLTPAFENKSLLAPKGCIKKTLSWQTITSFRNTVSKTVTELSREKTD